MTNREKSTLATRAKLLKTGQKLITKHGLSNISVEDITNAAGVAKGTFYTHFKRKEDIVFEMCRDMFVPIRDEFMSDNKTDIATKLSHYFEKFMIEVQRYGVNITREWLRDVITPATVTDAKDAHKWQYDTAMLREMLDWAVENKYLKPNTPTETLTHIIISQMYGMMLCWCMSDEEFNPRDWVQKFCDTQLRVILQPYSKEKK